MRPSLAFLVALPALTLAAVIASPHHGTALAAPPAERRPVVVELFSSEGCSSCPPADVVLDRLARDQPVPGAEVIALELHVDYWDYLGWTDPFSSAAFTTRQRAYADAFGQRGVYTPQLVVDGAADLLGSSDAGARAAIATAAREPKAQVAVTRTGDHVSITVTDAGEKTGPADVWLAVTEDGLSTAVRRGENAGATLSHGPVVRTLDRVATLPGTPGAVTTKDVELTVQPSWRREGLRAVAFVQRRASLHIAGAGVLSLR